MDIKRLKKMKVRDMIEKLTYPCKMALMNADEKMICITVSHSEGTEPYFEREIKGWHLPNPIKHTMDAEIFLILEDK